MLPDKPTQEIMNYYVQSKCFCSNHWKDSCDIWYELHKRIHPLDINSVCQVGLGPQFQGGLWNDLLSKMFDADKFTNIDIMQDVVDRARVSNNPRLKDSHICDVRQIDESFEDNSFDLVMWSHGPEHIVRGDWDDTFRRLEKVASKAIILQCPWGNGYDYDHEHVSKSVTEHEFGGWGYDVLTCGVKNTRDAGILAWKIL